MLVIQIVFAFFWMGLVPFLTGCLWSKLLWRAERWNVFFVTGIGLAMQYALYELLALVFIVLDQSFRLLCKLYAAGAVILALAGMIVLLSGRKQAVCLLKKWRNEKWKGSFPDGYLAAAILLMFVQLAAILIWATPDSDDAFYSGLSSMSIAGDYILKYDAYSGLMRTAVSRRYAISALPVYQASLQLLSFGLNHLFITHNLFPLFYMPLANGLYDCVGRILAPDDVKKQHRYLFFFVLIHIFGNTFVFSPENFLMTRIWQGKALFVCLSIPMICLVLDGFFGGKKLRDKLLWALLLIVVFAATVFMGETGLFLGPLLIVALGLAYATVSKLETGQQVT